jgi:hypothetical protein
MILKLKEIGDIFSYSGYYMDHQNERNSEKKIMCVCVCFAVDANWLPGWLAD